MADVREWKHASSDFMLNVDIVFVIDATLSMQHSINLIKATTTNFYADLKSALNECGRTISRLRVKIIWFRDIYFDGEFAFGESKFYELPDENDSYKIYVSSIYEGGGGGLDDDETSLEALTTAMRSDFNQDGRKKRHIIVLFTDSGAHPLERYDDFVQQASEIGCTNMKYPDNMPKSLDEVIAMWNGTSTEELKIDADGKRMILFAPDTYPWNKLDRQSYIQHSSISLKQGGKEVDLDLLYEVLRHSI